MDVQLVEDWIDDEEDEYDEFLRLSMRAFFISSTCFTNPVEDVGVEVEAQGCVCVCVCKHIYLICLNIYDLFDIHWFIFQESVLLIQTVFIFFSGIIIIIFFFKLIVEKYM